MPTVVIVGGGLSGLSLAYRLQQAAPHVEITLLEKDDRPGGKIHTEARDGFRVEHGPNGFLDTKPTTADLCRDLGLGPRLVAASDAAAKNRFLLLRGRLQRLPDSFGSFLRSPVLSWRGRSSTSLLFNWEQNHWRPSKRFPAPASTCAPNTCRRARACSAQ